jgi:hypothetical protein
MFSFINPPSNRCGAPYTGHLQVNEYNLVVPAIHIRKQGSLLVTVCRELINIFPAVLTGIS